MSRPCPICRALPPRTPHVMAADLAEDIEAGQGGRGVGYLLAAMQITLAGLLGFCSLRCYRDLIGQLAGIMLARGARD